MEHPRVAWATKLLYIAFLLLVGFLGARPLYAQTSSAEVDQSNALETFYVVLQKKAELDVTAAPRDWEARGRFVVGQLQTTAENTQAGIRTRLDNLGVKYRSFWIANAIRVTASKVVMEEMAARSDVKHVVSEGVFSIPKPLPGKNQPRVNAVDWNIERVRAPEAWSTFGARGEGIVIANIDTGVEYEHPALTAKYRGNLGGGDFDHNYNWFDPSNICGFPSLAPCDNDGHGTHTMGTMVGDDGDPGPNQIGVAPGASWIAVKGCEDLGCSFEALLASGEWVLAPSDLDGNNPRSDLRPHIINNSWGGGPGDPFYEDIINAWVAAGIFPAFSNGNDGPACSTSGSPGDYVQNYSSGAFDINNTIAGFSGRGPSTFEGEIKPNIAAPGVDVRSSALGGGYRSLNGTSMASPHTAGVVALMWSVAPALVGDIENTRNLLDQTAIDTSDLSCGGTATDNNIWGEGRLDAFAAVDLAPRGPTGTLQGQVTAADSGAPLAAATVEAIGPTERTSSTNDSGEYNMRLPAGTYEITTGAFGYLSQTASGIEIIDDGITTHNVTLDQAPSYSVSGVVYDDNGSPVANATVSIPDTPIPPVTTNASGNYSFASVPEGEYEIQAKAGECNLPQTLPLSVSGDTAVDFTLPRRFDSFGYFCEVTPFNYIEANTILPLSGDDVAVQVDLPFPFTHYGETYNAAYITTNGYLNFLGRDSFYSNVSIPNQAAPNAAIYPLWDDLYIDEDASVRTEVLGSAPDRQFVIEWRNAAFLMDTTKRVGFEVILQENGHILTQYTNIDSDGLEQGNSATIGIENAEGSTAFQYSFEQPTLAEGLAVRYAMPPAGFIEGYVTDAVDDQPVVGASLRALQDGNVVRETTTDIEGFYRLQVPVGNYMLEATAADYSAVSVVTDVAEGQTATQNFELESARAQIMPSALQFTAVPGQIHTQVLTLENVGLADLTFAIAEVAVADASPELEVSEDAKSQTPPADYEALGANQALNGGSALVFMDLLPWGSDALLQVLSANDIDFDTADSAQMGSIDLSNYNVVFISSDQPQNFYTNYNANLSRFSDFVEAGGFLWVGAAAWGWNGGDFNGSELPGGGMISGPVFDDFNDVIDNLHPAMQGVPNPFFGTSASHAAFENLPPEANIIARGQSSGLPTLIEYGFGNGRVLALGQTLEFGFQNGQDTGRVLENSVPYAAAFDPVTDVPWLAADPVSGTVAPGARQQIQVEINTTGLAPGLYRARLRVQTNDPRNTTLQVPVTLIVPAYQQAVNAGGDAYTGLAGEIWDADQMFSPGSWGYVDRSRTRSTRRDITGTDDDPLFQQQREDVLEYRFDDIPEGVYEIDLRFAELRPILPNQRLFHILLEGEIELYAHDVALAVGSFAADQHTFFVPVTDGQLNVRLFPLRRSDKPIINALRITHRPDQ